MASTIYFNGRVTAVPGSYSEIDASGMSRIGLGAVGIIALLGEAEGGAPYTEDIPDIVNPGKVNRTYRQGDLREAGPMLFSPSKDPGIPGGASEVMFVKVNPATQSARTFDDDGSADALTITSKDWGLFTTRISLEITAGTNKGYAVTIVFETTTETIDDIGGDPIFALQYTPGTNGATRMTVAVDPTSGIVAAFGNDETGLRADYVGSIGSIVGLDSEKTAAVGAGHAVNIVSSSAGDTTQSVTIYGTDGSNLPQTEVLALNGTSVVVGVSTWNKVLGVTLSAVCAGTVTVKDNTAATVLYTVAPAATKKGMKVFTDPVEAALATVSLIANGATVKDVIVVGTNQTGTPTVEKVTLTGAVLVTSSGRWTAISALALGDVEAARTLTLSGLLLDSGDVLHVVSSNVGDTTQSVTVYGLSAAGAVQTETLDLNGTTSVVGVLTWSKVLGMAASAAHLGTITLSAPTESVSIFALLTGDLYAGFVPIDRLAVDGSTVTIVLDASTTPEVDILVVGLDAVGAAQVAKLTTSSTTPVVSTGKTWSEITGLGIAHLPAARTLTLSGNAFNLTTGGYPTADKVTDRVSQLEGWAVTEIADDVNVVAMDDTDLLAATTAIGAAVEVGADLQRIVDAINEGSNFVTAERASGANAPPAFTSNPAFLTGGIEGSTAFGDWQGALDALKALRVNTVVLLTDDEAVHAAAASHAVYMAGPGRSERDVVVGAASGETLDELKARTLALNTRHVRLMAQDVLRFNTDGAREQFPPYFTGCLAAGMQSGAKVGTPLTFKFVDGLDFIGNDDDWTIVDDAEAIIQGGICVVEAVPNEGFRWLRQISTYRIDDNLAYTECSTNHAVNIAVYEFRKRMEAAVGKPGFAGTVNAALEVAIKILGELVTDGVIVEWRDLVIELAADVMDVDVSIAPTVPVNFVRNTVHLVTSSFSAAA